MITNKLFILGIAFLFLISLTSASFQLQNYNITTTYSSGDFVKGWINISFSDEDFNSTFVTNRGDSITLFNLLKSNELVSECVTGNCDIDYINSSSGETPKIISLNADEEKLVGIKITSNVIELNSMDFAIRSSALQSYYNQLKIDVFDDGTIVLTNA